MLLIGEANSTLPDNQEALAPEPDFSHGYYLMKLLGLSRDEYLKRYDRALLSGYKWSPWKAQKMATALLLNAPQDQVIVLLGQRVTKAFGLNYMPFTAKGRYRILPHPGKKNSTWDMEENCARARRLLGLV
jgi:hypothetical protein